MSSKVSIIVNFHNCEKYLSKCIQSILLQNYKNFEVILWDNKSNDSSGKIAKKFIDKRIRYFFNKRKVSLYEARNQAVKVSTGDLIAFLDADDWWDENYLSSRANFFNNEKYDYFCSNVYMYYEKYNKKKKYKNYILPSGYIYNYLAKDYFIIISGLMIKRKIIDQVGNFNNNFNIIGDFEYLMKISKNYYAHTTSDPLVFYRCHNSNFSKINSKIFYEEFNSWFNNQLINKDKIFQKNIRFFKKKLLSLEINYLLSKKNRDLILIKKILEYPDIIKKIKYIIAFFIPKKILNSIK